MPSAQDKAKAERAIFRMFTKACGLRIKLRSIRSRPEPEPDIRCTIVDEGTIAFELGEVVGQRFAETTNQRSTLRRRFREAYANLPELVRIQLKERFGGSPMVFVSFRPGTSPGKWANAIPSILSVLAERVDNPPGSEVPVWTIPSLKDVLTEMDIRGGTGSAPSLHVMEATARTDATLALLKKKFAKRYQSRVPIELVAYYASQPPPGGPTWLKAVESLVSDGLGTCPFRRVWLFDGFTKTIPLVIPKPTIGGKSPGTENDGAPP